MNKSLLFAALGLVAVGAAAQEVGRVLSATPIIQQVAVPRQVCQDVVVPSAPVSGGAGILGAIAGAAIGSQIGDGSGRGVATVLGTLGGAVLGNSIEANAASGGRLVPHCSTQTSYENRTVGYHVTYEYNGRQYTVQMPHDPGPTVRLQVTPVGSAATSGPGVFDGAVIAAPAPAPIVVATPAPVIYPGYSYPPVGYAYPQPVYRPVPIGISLTFSSGHRHHRHHYHHPHRWHHPHHPHHPHYWR